MWYTPIWPSIGTGIDASRGYSPASKVIVDEPAKARAKVVQSEKAGQGVIYEDLGIRYDRSCFYEYFLDLSMTRCTQPNHTSRFGSLSLW